MEDVVSTLTERGKRYGAFTGHADIAQDLKRAMKRGNWTSLRSSQREALEMIQHKIARILNGDPDYADSWHDIAGYATLVEAVLSAEARKAAYETACNAPEYQRRPVDLDTTGMSNARSCGLNY